jgi:hypothetical protein
MPRHNRFTSALALNAMFASLGCPIVHPIKSPRDTSPELESANLKLNNPAVDDEIMRKAREKRERKDYQKKELTSEY